MPDNIKYGLKWKQGMSYAEIEIEMIRRGGRFQFGDKWVGNGLFYHYKELETILWGKDKVWHKWNELQLKHWLENRTLAVIGPSSSGKTNSTATDHLAEFYCFPHETTILICSTTAERLQDRIFGEIKRYHRLAREKYPWLPGETIESRMRIVTETGEEAVDGRDFRNGICFPSGSMVDTPDGPKQIESLVIGDVVWNATGKGVIAATHKSIAKQLVRISLSDGRIIDCTDEHPIFTTRGWVKAADLTTLDMVLSAHETMQIMRTVTTARVSKQKVLRADVGTWVESVEILKPSSDTRFNVSGGGYTVYNLSVGGHPSYSVNGVVVHNCGVACLQGGQYRGIGSFIGIKNARLRVVFDELQMLPPAILLAISNLDKNENFKATGLGNPKDTTDALGVFAEPSFSLGGWEGGIDQTEVTKVWPTRRPNGACLQLVGTDSPNLDGKLGIPLITQEAIDRDVEHYGKDSLQFSMMNLGMMPKGQGSRRVVTRQMCHKNKAYEPAVWLNSERTRFAALDAAYKGVGGDRCVLMKFEMGFEAATMTPGELDMTNLMSQKPTKESHKQVIELTDVQLVPIDIKLDIEAEDQIVNFCHEQCSTSRIDPSHFFYDSGMRTALVSAFGRLWSVNTNPIDCGGMPSERPVSNKIEKLCREYYSKLVTEFWFSVRLAIECQQLRGLKESVVDEGCMREWKIVAGNKIEVEPKHDMKKKTGRSPDLFDTLAIGVEGARRLGFVIDQKSITLSPDEDRKWKKDLAARRHNAWHSGSLDYAA